MKFRLIEEKKLNELYRDQYQDPRRIKVSSNAAAYIDDIAGQMSDGYWENSPRMEGYWKFFYVDGDDIVIAGNWDEYSSGYFHGRYISNLFKRMSDTEVKEFFADKIKFMVKAELKDNNEDPVANWNRNSDYELDYLHGTIADAYKAYDELKGRKLKEDIKLEENKKCIICGEEIKGYGNNAEPVKKGQCCDKCNKEVVIPARLKGMKKSLDLDEALGLKEDKSTLIEDFNGISYWVCLDYDYPKLTYVKCNNKDEVNKLKRLDIASGAMRKINDYHNLCLISYNDEHISIEELGCKTKAGFRNKLKSELEKYREEDPEGFAECVKKGWELELDSITIWGREGLSPNDLDSIIDAYFKNIKYSYVDGDSESALEIVNIDKMKLKAQELSEIYEDNYDEDEYNESLKEDTIKQNGKWVNKGKEGTHGTFRTKKEADAQRKAMFAQGFKEDLEECIYLFPELTEEDKEELHNYDLAYLGKNHFMGEISDVVKGSEEDLIRYGKEYLDYILHPDYLYKEEDFAGEIVNEKLERNDISDFFDKAKRLGITTVRELKDLLAQEESKGNTEKEKIDAYADSVRLGKDTLSNEGLNKDGRSSALAKFRRAATIKDKYRDSLSTDELDKQSKDSNSKLGKLETNVNKIIPELKKEEESELAKSQYESLEENLNKESLEQEIRKAIREHFKTWDDEDYEDMIGEYLVVEVADQEDGRTKVEVRAELTYGTMDKIADELNKIVQKYDKDAYFDHEDAGIINAFIDKNAEGKVIDEYNVSKDEKLQGVRLRDYRNKWSAIDHMEVNGTDYYMFENDTYGDETYYVVTSNINDGPFYETFDDIETCLRDEGVLEESLKEDLELEDEIYNAFSGEIPIEAIRERIKNYPGIQYEDLYDMFADDIEDSELDEKLIQGKSDATLKKNIATEVKAGKDPKQAYAIAKSIQKKNESFEDEHLGEVVKDDEIVDYFDNSVHDKDIIEDDFDEEHIEELAKKAIEESKKHTKEVGTTINENKTEVTPTQELINESVNSNEEIALDYVSPNAVDANFQAQEVDLNNI